MCIAAPHTSEECNVCIAARDTHSHFNAVYPWDTDNAAILVANTFGTREPLYSCGWNAVRFPERYLSVSALNLLAAPSVMPHRELPARYAHTGSNQPVLSNFTSSRLVC